MPIATGQVGENVFIIDTSTLWVVLKGSVLVDIQASALILVSFNVSTILRSTEEAVLRGYYGLGTSLQAEGEA